MNYQISCHVGRYETGGKKEKKKKVEKPPRPGRTVLTIIVVHTFRRSPVTLRYQLRSAAGTVTRGGGGVTGRPANLRRRRRHNPFDISCSFVRLSVRRWRRRWWRRRQRRRPRCRAFETQSPPPSTVVRVAVVIACRAPPHITRRPSATPAAFRRSRHGFCRVPIAIFFPRRRRTRARTTDRLRRHEPRTPAM